MGRGGDQEKTAPRPMDEICHAARSIYSCRKEMVMLQNLRAFPLHYLVACLMNGLAVVAVPSASLTVSFT